jgi:hypothetical protein
LRERWIEGDPATAEEEHGDEWLGPVKAKGAASDHAEAGVEALDDGVGQAIPDVSDDAVEVLSNCPGDPDERLQPGPGGPTEPLLEGTLGSSRLLVVEGLSQGLLEQVGAVERGVGALEFVEPLALDA